MEDLALSFTFSDTTQTVALWASVYLIYIFLECLDPGPLFSFVVLLKSLNPCRVLSTIEPCFEKYSVIINIVYYYYS